MRPLTLRPCLIRLFCDIANIDMGLSRTYLMAMASLVRALVIALIAVITAWSVAQTASATSMSLAMASMTTHDDGAMNEAHCHEHDCQMADGGVSVPCDMVCASPAVADLTASIVPSMASLVSTLHVVMPTADLRGRADPPDPFPPRVPLLI